MTGWLTHTSQTGELGEGREDACNDRYEYNDQLHHPLLVDGPLVLLQPGRVLPCKVGLGSCSCWYWGSRLGLLWFLATTIGWGHHSALLARDEGHSENSQYSYYPNTFNTGYGS